MASARRSSGLHTKRPNSRDQDKEEIWKPMLDNISSGKRLPEKSLLVLGGTPETQRDFLESIATDSKSNRRPPDRGRKPPIANQFALGYTYQDVLDSDHEDTIARLSLHLLANPSPSFTPLIKPYLNPRTIPHTLVVILLDWNHPWLWARQLRDWIRVLRSLISSLDEVTKEALDDNIAPLMAKGRSAAPTQDDITEGEWDVPLGVPLCVVCQNTDKTEVLARERGWREDQFDFIQSFLRTILLKHGGSLIYTMPSAPGHLQSLIHFILDIPSATTQVPHNFTDRDRVLIPTNWDAWGKIRVLRPPFEFEDISHKWSVDIKHTLDQPKAVANGGDQVNGVSSPEGEETEEEPTATSVYENTISNPGTNYPLSLLHPKQANGIEVSSRDTQNFLQDQVEILEVLRREDEGDKASNATKDTSSFFYPPPTQEDVILEEHIGPVQFNMGGISLNADAMVKSIQERENHRTGDSESGVIEARGVGDTSPTGTSMSMAPVSSADSDGKLMDNDKLMSFFSGLLAKGPSTGPTGSK